VLGADGIAFWKIWATNYFLERSKLLNFKVIKLVLDCRYTHQFAIRLGVSVTF
jgi:hypothetical protein